VVNTRTDSKPDSCVTCAACSYEIRIANTARPPGEFSLQCPNCRQRKVYQLLQAHDQPDAATAHASARIQFSTGKKELLRPRLWPKWATSLRH
jgi:hypothetical protein